MDEKPTVLRTTLSGAAVVLAGLLVLCIVVSVFIGGCSGIKAWSRAQKRANANNAVKLTSIQVRKQLQHVRVVRAMNGSIRAQAYQRYLESVGVREAQNEIAKTLTPAYLTYEEIKAQQAVATSGRNNTVVYVPSGQGGVPTITASAGSGK